MALNAKLSLQSFLEEEDYVLIAIHCSSEAYKLAFYLNQGLGLKLAREEQDVDFNYKDEGIAYYPLFKFSDEPQSCLYYLFSNEYCALAKDDKKNQSPTTLFQSQMEYCNYLVPEYKEVDFFLKIEDQHHLANTKAFKAKINKLKPVIKAYEVHQSTLKSNENLIFS